MSLSNIESPLSSVQKNLSVQLVGLNLFVLCAILNWMYIFNKDDTFYIFTIFYPNLNQL